MEILLILYVYADTFKGSFYANPILDIPTTNISLIQRYSEFAISFCYTINFFLYFTIKLFISCHLLFIIIKPICHMII